MRALLAFGFLVVLGALLALLLLCAGAGPEAGPPAVGLLLGIAGALAFGLPRRLAVRALRHAALWLCCVVFALPLYFLVSTSFKYEEEVLVTPPRWVPEIPKVVRRSPYQAREPGGAVVERGLRLRAPSVQDRRLQDHGLRDALGGLRVEGPARLVPQGEAEEVTVAYDLRQAEGFTIQVALPLPFPAAELRGVSLPLCADRSWNGLEVTLEVAGRRYQSQGPLPLGGRRWQELTFRLVEAMSTDGARPRDERDLGIWPLTRVAGAAAPGDGARLTLQVVRASALQVVWRKYGASYVQAYLLSERPLRYLRNSLILVALSVLGQVLSSALVAYAFARLRWPGRDPLFLLLLLTLMVPSQVTLVPTFLLMKWLGLYNTLAALWLPNFCGSAVYIFLLRQFMKGIPVQLEDAAKIDGCGHLGIFVRVILPLLRPALAAVALFTFVTTWNDFLGPLLYLNDPRLYPLSLGLHEFRGEHGSDHGVLMAAATLVTLPVAGMFLLFQRSFLQSLSLTGIKG